MTPRESAIGTRTVLLWLLLAGLFILSYMTLRWFIVPVVWALILAYATWPMYARLRRGMRGAATSSALLMTLLLTAAFVLPLLGLVGLLQDEFVLAYQAVSGYINAGPQRLPAIIKNIPWIGERLQQIFDHLAGDPAAFRTEALQLAQNWFGQVAELVGGVGRNAAKMGMAVLTVLFVYRDGESLLAQVQRVLRRFIGVRAEGYLDAIGATTKAVLYGLVLTALAQGTLAGLGYWAAGIHAPALLGALTALVALIPFGAPVIWGSLGVWLLMTGQTLAGIGLLLWGALVVSWVDNLIRPLVISSAAQIPFLLVLFGVLGGLGAFGLVGMFVGPVIVAVLLAVWREWLEERAPDEVRVHRLHD
ncbi:AI-2E family transporter [Noviherbaspirillum denitrificans]|uniref:Permease n=1 Tax=Noviherbaspirillum denitrificans TaxID=1968433 RepID=A0A254TFR4_9BURK|nr:AI-2E family transporter [Noviherbaspirillum denitrificans]OWW21365.1 permease [Noviherbaspirillum denitrificans]